MSVATGCVDCCHPPTISLLKMKKDPTQYNLFLYRATPLYSYGACIALLPVRSLPLPISKLILPKKEVAEKAEVKKEESLPRILAMAVAKAK